MKKIWVATFLVSSLFCASSYASSIPFQPSDIGDYSKETIDRKTHARLRLAVSLDQTAGDTNLKVGKVVVCSVKACYRPHTKDYIAVSNTLNGSATIVFDSLVPYDNITSVYIDDVVGEKIITGPILLNSPLKIEDGFQGGEILLILKKRKAAKGTVYEPEVAVSALFDSEAQSVYYNPKFSLAASIGSGVSIAIPPGALKTPQIFSAAVRDTGNSFPQVDILPYIELDKEFTLTSDPAFMKKNLVPDYDRVPETPLLGVNSLVSSKSTNSVTAPVTKKFSKMGVLKFSSVSSVSAYKASSASVQNVDTQCSQIIANPANLAVITGLLPQVGVVDVNWCQNIEPYVHIMVINRRDSRIRYKMNYLQQYPEVMYLTQISDPRWAPNSMAAINGFYWVGDRGISANQTGRPSGYVSDGFNRIGVNYTNGISQGNKRLFLSNKNGSPVGTLETFWWDRSTGNEFFGEGTILVSSSTSVVKDGVCTGDTVNDRWSAIGAQNSNGLMVMISSTSDSQTNAASLCKIFLALGVTNALRLDGGPSAGLTKNNVLQNPLTGTSRLIYSSVRYTAYSLKVTYGEK